MKTELVRQELEAIRQASGGLIRPKDVVAYARENPQSAIASEMEWDDTEAAELYRLQQARRIIRASVIVINSKDNIPVEVRAYISLPSDRPGYRSTAEIVSNESLASEALRMFQREIERLRVRFANIALLAGILDDVSERLNSEQEKSAKANLG